MLQVLCSVTDMDKCLKEVQRVVRPGGKFLFLEHIGARPGGILRALQRTFNPAWKRTFEGCNLNRDTLIHIKQSGELPARYTDLCQRLMFR